MIFKKKYNRIDIKTLEYGHVDGDVLIVHGMMQVLTNYIEQELLAKTTWEKLSEEYEKCISKADGEWDKESITKQYENEKKLYEIYQWWHHRGKSFDAYKDIEEFAENCECGDSSDRCLQCRKYFTKIHVDDEAFEAEVTEKCKQLIELRFSMWS